MSISCSSEMLWDSASISFLKLSSTTPFSHSLSFTSILQPWMNGSLKGDHRNTTTPALACLDAREYVLTCDKISLGFQEYMAGCDGLALASVPDQLASRIGYWNAALSAFHITNDTTNN